VFALGLAAGTAQAQKQSRGALEYENSCQACHGAKAKGDGPMAAFLTIPVPDLTTIAKRNDGHFPIEEIMEIIDGRKEVRGHGSPMPVWGTRYKVEAGDKWGPWGSGAELFARSRILELTFYLQSIQE
jgi:mono/diheme cytochrome c family protein